MRYLFTYILVCIFLTSIAQESLKIKQQSAVRIDEKITIDGELNEPAWQKAEAAKDFTTYDPVNGSTATEGTEVKILYDNEAIYIGAFLYDKEPDKILKEFTKRDGTNANADAFWITLNPYADGQNIFQFQVSAVNVQTDVKISAGSYDYNWNAVWFSGTKISDKGWFVEMQIPYAAIRLPKTQEQVWDVNFWRLIRRIRETSSWNFVDKKVGNMGAQSGKLSNIKDIKSPLRLSLFPYISAYTQHNSNLNKFSYSFIGGMDVKYGINESFTLDMTLIPDFGQTKSDDKVLNLSPYEIRYTENRQFFTEGTELFNKAGLFYSRRIGDIPSGYYSVESSLNNKEVLKKNPTEARLINATKISGRNKNNLGLGFFNAMTGNTYATYEDTLGTSHNLLTEPFTNYNIIVADQAFRKNSYVNIINTNMYQHISGEMANVTGTTFRVYEKRDLYALYGTAAVSYKSSKLRYSSMGEYYNLNAGKLNGNFTFNYGVNIITDQYNPNDMAYLAHNNDFSHTAGISYRVFQPFWKFLGCYSTLNYNYKQLYKPNVYTGTDINLESGATFKNYLSIGLSFNSGLKKLHDYFEARVPNRLFIKSRYDSFSTWISTDYRKPFALDINLNTYISEWNNKGLWATVAPRIRVNDHFLFVYSFSHGEDVNDRGYVSLINNDSIVFGLRNVKVITNSFTGTYVFTNKSYLSLNIRHYWSTVNYREYFLLNENGVLNTYAGYSGNHDFNYNVFTIDMVYSWNFAPGSFINVMWKNNITKSENIPDNHFDDFFQNFDRAINFPQVNSLSVKISYYVDYQYFQRKKSTRK